MVKSKPEKGRLGKTKYLESESSSADKEESSSEASEVERKHKKLPKSKSSKKIDLSESSSEEVRNKKKDKGKKGRESEKDKKKSKKIKDKRKKYESESESESESDRKKKSKKDKKKKYESESESESETDKKKKSKKDKRKKYESESESESEKHKKIKSRKGRKLVESSEEEEKVQKKKKVLSSEDEKPIVKKPKIQSSSDEEPLKINQKVTSSQAQKSLKTKKIAKSSSSDDPYKSKAASKPIQSLTTKPKAKPQTPTPPSSPSSSHSSDQEEQTLLLEKKKKMKAELPSKRKAPEATIKPVQVAIKPLEAKAAPTPVSKPLQTPQNLNTSTDLELFIGGLAYEATEDDLRNHFSQFGEIVNVSVPQKNGSPSGIAFISFTDPESVQNAMSLNNTVFMNRTLRVNLASNKSSRPPPTSTGPSSGASSTVFVGNIPYLANEDMMKEFFSSCGEVKQVRLAKLPTGELRGFGHIEFFDNESASNAVKLAGSNIEGRPIKVEFAVEKSQRSNFEAPKPMRTITQSFAGTKIKL